MGAPPVGHGWRSTCWADLDPFELGAAARGDCRVLSVLSGLITGFFTNQAAYDDIGARLAQHPG